MIDARDFPYGQTFRWFGSAIYSLKKQLEYIVIKTITTK
jgi:hypothetical protein